ncbi:MAG: type II toxin-antitoxin system RelE/ParE family toxin [Thermodesulfobacteriota bacterium]|nr:type II toxin-antitoxin system RelE/ParE family toxin [Thermodesulfobacteriota bacterium]
MDIYYSRQAQKYLRKMPTGRAETIMLAIGAIAKNRDSYPGDLIRMTNSPYFRLRVGGYRAIIDLNDGELRLLVLKIGVRGDVYK